MAEWSCRPSAVLTPCPSDQQEKLRIDTTHNNRAITIPIITSTRVLCLVSCISSSSPSTFRIGGVNVLPSLWRLIVMHRYKLKFDLILIVKCLHNFPPTKFGVCENCCSSLWSKPNIWNNAVSTHPGWWRTIEVVLSQDNKSNTDLDTALGSGTWWLVSTWFIVCTVPWPCRDKWRFC